MISTEIQHTLSGLMDAPLAIVAGSVLAVLLVLQVAEGGFVSTKSSWTRLVNSELCMTAVGAQGAASCQLVSAENT